MKKWIRASLLICAAVTAWVFVSQAAVTNKSFRIVLVPERNIFEQQRKYRNLCDYISKQLPMDFTCEVLKEYKEVLKALKDEKADGAFMGSFIAAYGIDRYGFIPLVRPVWASGASHYTSYIFKRAGLSITRDIETWRGRSFVFVGPHTSAGFYYPLSLLREKGIKEPGKFFSGSQSVESHDAALWMVANNLADLGAAKNTVYKDIVKRKPDLGNRLELLYSGGNFPDSTLMVRADLKPEIRESIRTTLLRMDYDQAGKSALKRFGARKFVEAASDDFNDVRQVVEKSGYTIKNMEFLGN